MSHRFAVKAIEPMIDFSDITETLQEEQGMNYRDMAGKYSKEAYAHREALSEKWLVENGFEGKGYVLNKPEGAIEDWPKDSVEMALRIAINTKRRADGFDKMLDNLYPYQDVWHYLLDADFADLHRCGVNILYLGEFEDEPEYVAKFRKAAHELVKGHPAYDADKECVACYIDW